MKPNDDSPVLSVTRTVRFSDAEVASLRAAGRTLALPVDLPDAYLIRAFALIGAKATERKNTKPAGAHAKTRKA